MVSSKTVTMAPRRVDASGSAARNTVAIMPLRKLVAPIGGVAGKGAAELASAPDERDC